MDDWRSKIDLYRQRQIQSDSVSFFKGQEGTTRKEDKEEKLRVRNVIRLQKKFHCQICGNLPQQPARKIIRFETVHPQHEFAVARSEPVYGDDWSKPGDLFRCDICKYWFCAEHIYKNICQSCAKGL